MAKKEAKRFKALYFDLRIKDLKSFGSSQFRRTLPYSVVCACFLLFPK